MEISKRCFSIAVANQKIMKVICINASERGLGNGCYELKEGNIYTVIKHFIGAASNKLCYTLYEIPSDGKFIGFLAERFVPLSEIDENELVKERETVLVK